MSKPLRFVQVGTGGMGKYWCSDVFPHLADEGKGTVVAAVDVVPEHLLNAQAFLGLPSERCYTSLETALASHEADAVAIIVPPAFHEDVVDAALRYGLDILSEKPIADTMSGACRVAAKVRQAGRKMCVTMSHRFDADKLALESAVRSGRYGAPNYLVQRFTHNCRRFGSWGEFRHRMEDPMLIEGSVHHFEMHRAILGANAGSVFARSWNPEWGEYAGDSTVLALFEMSNGTRVLYEAAKANAATLNGWGNDYVRVECADATLELDTRSLRALRSGPGGPPEPSDIPIDDNGAPTMNPLIAELFCDWVEGRRLGHPTAVEDNLQCTAMVFAARESARTMSPVDVQAFLATHLEEAGLPDAILTAPPVASTDVHATHEPA
jgi:predicted dehydrogenase